MYPIKYAVMLIITRLNKNSLGYCIKFYVAVKCYLVSEKVIYNMDGTTSREYEIVFMVKDNHFNKKEIQYPDYNLGIKNYMNSTKTNLISDNYEEIKECAKNINEGDVISVRGYGKFLFNAVSGTTKKGRNAITYSKYK